MPFARIAPVAAVTMLVALTGCDHSPPRPAAEQQPAATAVPPESATGSPRPTPASASASPSPKHRAKPTAGPDAGSGSTGLDRFVAAVQRKLPDIALDRRDEEVEDLGEQACDALGNGRGPAAAAGEISAQGVPPADARTLVGLAKDTLCRS